MSISKDTKLPMEEGALSCSKDCERNKTPSIQEGCINPLILDEADEQDKPGFTGSTEQHSFSLPANAEYWRQVYEKAKYEGRHRFDPSLQWGSTEEKRLVRKVSISMPCDRLRSCQSLTLTYSAQAKPLHHGLGLDHVFISRSDPSKPESCSIRQYGIVDC